MTRDGSSRAATPPDVATDRRSVTLARFEPRRDLRPSEAVLDAVSAAERADPGDLRSRLGESVDTDALDALFSNGSAPTHLAFRYAEYLVEVHDDGWVRVREATDADQIPPGDRFEGDLSSG